MSLRRSRPSNVQMLPSLQKLRISPKSIDADYDPSVGKSSSLQSYFSDMLMDSDRNARYFEAIKACIDEFIRIERRAPVVLDAGCGTGWLSACALVAGAERVIAVDVGALACAGRPSADSRLSAPRVPLEKKRTSDHLSGRARSVPLGHSC